MKKAMLTGGNGFIGSHLVNTLVAMGVEVHAISNENSHRLYELLPAKQVHVLRRTPYAASDLVVKLQPDTIFHLAAVYEEPLNIRAIAAMVDGNLALGMALLFGASQCKHPSIFVNTGSYWQFAEDGSFSPNTLYAATKQAFQDLLSFYEKRGFVSATTLILYDTFGPDDRRSKLWSELIRQPPGTTIQMSAGDQYIELVAIADVVQAFLAAVDLLETHGIADPLYAVSSGNPLQLRDIVNTLNERADLRLQFEWGARPYWEGQVLRPWQGKPVPGWSIATPAIDGLVDMANQSRAARTSTDL